MISNKATPELPNSIEIELREQQAFELSDETICEASEYGEIQEYSSEFYYDENKVVFFYRILGIREDVILER